jgi:hypothetical protein
MLSAKLFECFILVLRDLLLGHRFFSWRGGIFVVKNLDIRSFSPNSEALDGRWDRNLPFLYLHVSGVPRVHRRHLSIAKMHTDRSAALRSHTPTHGEAAEQVRAGDCRERPMKDHGYQRYGRVVYRSVRVEMPFEKGGAFD